MIRLINFLRSHATYYHPRISSGHVKTNSVHNEITLLMTTLVFGIIIFKPIQYYQHVDLALEPNYKAFPYNQ